MKESPIIFSTEMVRAILEGRKTQTRRIVKPQAHHYNPDLLQPFLFYPCKEGEAFGDIDKQIKSPYGYPWKEWKKNEENDRLWVREDFAETILYDGNEQGDYYYKADIEKSFSELRNRGGWKSSRFMPKDAARIFLEIINIKVQRLNDISEVDAKQEGALMLYRLNGVVRRYHSYKKCFSDIWNSIHKKENRWKDNPWVWVIEFKRVDNG